MYKHGVVGGTFDRFHTGHKKLLNATFSNVAHLTIGIATDSLYENKLYPQIIEPYEKRVSCVKEYLIKNNFAEKTKIIPIDDIYGTTLQDKTIDAIFVTEESKKNAEVINARRVDQGFSSFKIITVQLMKSVDGKVISSGRIRKGEIDREGNVYRLLFSNTLQLPVSLRTVLRKPIGSIFQNINDTAEIIEKASMVIAVGDIVSLSLAAIGKQADLSVVDFRTRRHELNSSERAMFKTLRENFIAPNKAGMIDQEAAEMLHNAIEHFLQTGEKQILKITGEEDLLTLPAILFAPLGTIVVYGQYGEGAVYVEVTEERKQEIVEIIKQFEPHLESSLH